MKEAAISKLNFHLLGSDYISNADVLHPESLNTPNTRWWESANANTTIADCNQKCAPVIYVQKVPYTDVQSNINENQCRLVL